MVSGHNYTLYLTPEGNASNPISRSELFQLRTVTQEMFGGAPGPAVGAAALLSAGMAMLALAVY